MIKDGDPPGNDGASLQLSPEDEKDVRLSSSEVIRGFSGGQGVNFSAEELNRLSKQSYPNDDSN